MKLEPRVIELYEYDAPQEKTREELPVNVAQLIRDSCKGKVSIEPASFHLNAKWRISSEGWVGYIPLTEDLGLRLQPKKGITITNIFRMLEYAYDLDSFHLLDGLTNCRFVEDLYERLAVLLAQRVLDRCKRGYYRDYEPQSDYLSYVRGRIDIQRACFTPWVVKPFCHFEEYTPNVEENRILAWTLSQILKSDICTNQSLPTVRHAYRRLAGFAELEPCEAQACIGRIYNRLNQDYKPMHALCRFFLENLGPDHEAGNRKMIPFLVNMGRLYELFVTRWLEKNLEPERYLVQSQEHVRIDSNLYINFKIDLSIFDNESQSYAFVMDTKYKVGRPTTDDIEQVVAYAESKGCKEAILIYPEHSVPELNGKVGKINIRSRTFSLTGDLDSAGRNFIREALGIEADIQSNRHSR